MNLSAQAHFTYFRIWDLELELSIPRQLDKPESVQHRPEAEVNPCHDYLRGSDMIQVTEEGSARSAVLTPAEMSHQHGAVNDQQAVEEISPGGCPFPGEKPGNDNSVKKSQNRRGYVGERAAW